MSSILTVISLPPECSEWLVPELSESSDGSRRGAGFGGTFLAGSVYSGISRLLVGDRSMYLSGSGRGGGGPPATIMAFAVVLLLLLLLLVVLLLPLLRMSGKFREVPGCGCWTAPEMLFPMAYGVISVRVLSEMRQEQE